MEFVTSRDGTRLAYHRRGAGPALVVVHGSGAANPVAWSRALEKHLTIFAMDRRGRGASGDGSRYALAREAEDVAVVVAAVRGPCSVLGHSFGALCALEAALIAPQVEKLILYEPLFAPPGAVLYPPGVVARLEALLVAGDREGVLTTVMRELAGMTPEELEGLRASSLWPERLASAHTLPRETRAEQEYVFDPERLGRLTLPVLLLTGSESPLPLREATTWLAAALPNSRVIVLEGQGHLAMYTAPEAFARHIVEFLNAPA